MTQEEKDIEVEKLRLGLVESYKAKALWSYTVQASISKIPSYRKREPIKEEIILVKSFWSSYYLVFVMVACSFYFALHDITSFQRNYIGFISLFGGMSFIVFLFSYYYQRQVITHISINKDCILFDRVMIPWTDIFQIYTASYSPASYSSRVFLCVALNDYSFKEFEVSNWAYRNIGNTLEHYRLTYIDKD